jgi:hypothetical protein
VANILSDGAGKPSAGRLMAFLSLFASVWFGYMTIAAGGGESGLYITSLFALMAFAPKALEKFIETSYPGRGRKEGE